MTIRGEESLRGLSLFFLRKIIRETLKHSFPDIFTVGATVLLDIGCVSDGEIAQLNKAYRGQEKPTDILSFGNVRRPADLSLIMRKREINLGQIILSPEYIGRSSQEDGVSWKREFVYVFSHGILHLLGFDHEEEMFLIQDEITDLLASEKNS